MSMPEPRVAIAGNSPIPESHEEKMARIEAGRIAWRRRMNAHKSNRRNRKASIGQADYEHEDKIARMGQGTVDNVPVMTLN